MQRPRDRAATLSRPRPARGPSMLNPCKEWMPQRYLGTDWQVFGPDCVFALVVAWFRAMAVALQSRDPQAVSAL